MNEDRDYQGAKEMDYQQRIFLAKEILSFEIIWDSKHPDYRNKQFRRTAWSQIASRQDLSEIVIRTEWKRLRDMYQQRLKSVPNEEIASKSGELHSLLQKFFSNRRGSEDSDMDEEAIVQKESDCEEPPTKKKLNNQERISLAEELLHFRIIWSSKHPDFYKASCRQDAWNQIAFRLGLDTAVIRAEWKRLREMYRRRLLSVSSEEGVSKWQSTLHVLLEKLFENEEDSKNIEENEDMNEESISGNSSTGNWLSYEKRLSLAKEFLNFRVIWDTEHPDYSNTQTSRADAWNQIAARQGIDLATARLEFKRFREMNRMRQKGRGTKSRNSLHVILEQLFPNTTIKLANGVEQREDKMEDNSDSEQITSGKKLSYEQRESLAEDFLNYSIIWDTKHPEFNKPALRHKAFEQIASQQGMHPARVRAEWKRLRNMYRRRMIRAANSDDPPRWRPSLHQKLKRLFPYLRVTTAEHGDSVDEEESVQLEEITKEDSDCEQTYSCRKKLSYDQKVSLVQELLNFSIVWDTKHPDHNKISCRIDAWNQIASRQRLDKAMVRAEYKRLRNMYRKRLLRAACNEDTPKWRNSLHVMLERLFPEAGTNVADESDNASEPDAEPIEEPTLVVQQCRLCLQWSPELESDGMFYSISSSLAEKIRHCLGIYVTPTDGVRGICSNCKGIVELISEFRALCEQTNEIYDSVRIRVDIHSKELGHDWKMYSSNVEELGQHIRRQQKLVDQQMQNIGYGEVLKPEHLSIKFEPEEANVNEDTFGYSSEDEQDDFNNELEPGEVKREVSEDESFEDVTKESVDGKFDELYRMIEDGNETKFSAEDTKPSLVGAYASQNVPEIERENPMSTPAEADDDDPIWDLSEETTICSETKKFTKRKRLEFAQACLQYPNLWDVNHPDYKYRLVRDKTWEEIAEQMGLPCSVLRKEWSRLQNVYRARNKRFAKGLSRADDYVMNDTLYQLCRTMMGDSGLVPALRKDGKPKQVRKPRKPREEKPDAFDYDNKLKLAREIEKREPLWNRKHPDHTKPYMSRMWRELGVIMGTTADVVRHEWRLLGGMHRAKLIRAAKGMSLKNPSSAVDPLNVLLDKFFEDHEIEAEATSSRYTLKPKFDNEGCFPVERNGVTRYDKICELCGKQVERSLFEFHMNQHNGLRPYVCNFEGCGRQYSNKIVRDRHEVMIHGQDGYKFECDQCGQKFKQKAPFEYHYAREHKSGPDVACGICGRVYKHKKLLSYHMRQHNSEPFDCKVCGKRLQTRYSFTVHQRIHTQEKPYPCDLCDERFMLKVQMKTHKTKVHGFSLPIQ